MHGDDDHHHHSQPQHQEQGAESCGQQQQGGQSQVHQQQKHGHVVGLEDRAGVFILKTPNPADLQLQQQSGDASDLQSLDTGEEVYSGPEDEYEETFEDIYTDSRVRRVELKAIGDRWVAGLQQLAAELQ